MLQSARSPNTWLLVLSAVLLLVVIAQLLGMRTLSQALERSQAVTAADASTPPFAASAPSAIPRDAYHAPLFTPEGGEFWRHHAHLFGAPSPAGSGAEACVDGVEAFGAEVPSVTVVELDDRVEVHVVDDGGAPGDVEAVLLGQHLSVSGPISVRSDVGMPAGDDASRFARMLWLPQPVDGARMRTEVRGDSLVIVLPVVGSPI